MRGYMYWTLVDNFEWNFAWELKFGLYEWNPDMGMERRLRDGAKVRRKSAFLVTAIDCCPKKYFPDMYLRLRNTLQRCRRLNLLTLLL